MPLGVYMVKSDMLNPNLTSKLTKNLNQSQKHRKDRLSKIQQIRVCLKEYSLNNSTQFANSYASRVYMVKFDMLNPNSIVLDFQSH